jgi:hypothetical protein
MTVTGANRTGSLDRCRERYTPCFGSISVGRADLAHAGYNLDAHGVFDLADGEHVGGAIEYQINLHSR